MTAPLAAVRYQIEVADTHAHLFRVTLSVPQPAAEQVLSLPVWIPGSYLVREFARHLSQLEARQGTRVVPLEQRDKTTWVATCNGRGTLTVSYLVYAFDNSVRTAFLDAQRGFFNGTSVFLRVHGREAQPHQVCIGGLPKGWSVATALPAAKVNALGAGDYQAADYDELVDHPVELGTFWRGSFKARGVPHEFVVAGAWPGFDSDRLLADARKICEAQIVFWHGKGKPPFKRYVFMLNVVDEGYGGLEHRASTALIASRRDLPRVGDQRLSDGYVTLLGLISHEYFHTWNVKRLKPREFEPYDYTQENYTQLLWFFEGFTSYYDDLLLRRAGLIDEPRYLQLLSKTVNQVLATPGRAVQSVAQASFDAWVKYYRPDENTANATVSYYTKGSLVALAFDLTLRQHGGTLDGVMHRLWALQRGIAEGDIRQALAAEAGRPLDAEFDAWVHGTGELPLGKLLGHHGLSWQTTPVNQPPRTPQELGMRLSETPAGLKVQAVMRGSAAEVSGVAAGDELLALDTWRLRKPDDLSTLLAAQPAPAARATKGKLATAVRPTLLVARDQRLLSLPLQAPRVPAQGLVSIKPDATATETAQLARQAWLGSTTPA
ncbi:M61 family metallopeptidase [Aquabacterium sp.]|uniref:M61 family metallopeptidase n=1 Tax=Aquabacterium sp. TaxID=1872578 RepID=UPI0035AE5B26